MLVIDNMEGKYLPKTDNFRYCIPDIRSNAEYWDNTFEIIRMNAPIKFPIQNGESTIDKYTGQYGYRWHPVKKQPNYFHSGIDINCEEGTEVRCVADGLFEYSGYHPVNGHYVLISHPLIKTEDGFTMFSMYLHLKSSAIRFNMLEKIIREIGLRKLTDKPIKCGQKIGYSGDTGNSKGIYSHLHLQIVFRKDDKTIVIDPCKLFDLPSSPNMTANIANEKEFIQLISQHDELKKWRTL